MTLYLSFIYNNSINGGNVENSIDKFYDYLTDKKCKDIAVYDLSKESQDCNIIFVVSISNALSNKKFALQLMNELNIKEYPEGYNKGEWIIFDLGDVIIHSFVTSVREKYNLDKLWKSKKVIINKQNKK